ncbi:MAG: hypothetical protein QXN83_03275 [Nitrososphaerales archaeon]
MASVFLEHHHVDASTAYLNTDKDKVSLGEDLTISLAEPDANRDSRSMERVPLNVILISTNKFDETPLDVILDRTGMRASQPFLIETGFNTGIFEVTLESINNKLVDRGSQIRVIYFETPAGGGSPVRIEKTVQVVEGIIAISFDRKEYSPFDQVEVKLLAQMFNVNRNKIDTLNTPSGGRVAITTGSGQTYYPPMFETDVNTGIFVGKVNLTLDKSIRDGDLIVTGRDRIVVTVSIIPGFVVSDYALVTMTLGSITFDRTEYTIGDVMKLTVKDLDANIDPNSTDTVKVRVWSNTDVAGMELELTETDRSTGIFEGTLALTPASTTEKNLSVSENDILVAVYTDRTVPSPTEMITSKDLLASAKIGIATNVMLSNPVVLDQNEHNVNIEVGSQTIIQASITNAKTVDETFVYIIRINDTDNFTSDLSFITGKLEAYQSISIGRQWSPQVKGVYTIHVLLWSGLEEPVILSPAKKIMVTVE